MKRALSLVIVFAMVLCMVPAVFAVPETKAFDDQYNTENPITATGEHDLTLGENAVATNHDGVLTSFTAAEEGTYILSTAEGEENAFVMLEQDSESVDLPYEFTMTAGETKGFIICTDTYGDDTVDLMLEKQTPAPVEMTQALPVGTTTLTLVPNTNYYLRLDLGLDVTEGTLTWDNEAVSVMLNEEPAASPLEITGYSRRTRILATVTAETTVTFTVEIPVVELQELTMGANAVEVEAGYEGTKTLFTAPKSGEYILSAAEGEENAFVSIEQGYTLENGVELPYSLKLEEGASVYIIVSADNATADTIDLVLEEKTEETLVLTVGENPVTLVPGMTYYLRVDQGDVLDIAGTMTWEGNVTVTAGGETITSPYDLSGYGMFNIPVATVESETAVNFVITLPEEAPVPELVLGDNAIAANYGGVLTSFTAAEEGTYILSAAEGEENACVMLEQDSESVDLPYEFTMTAGETKGFIICTDTYGDDTVDLMLEKVPEKCVHTPETMTPVIPAAAPSDHNIGVKALYLCLDCQGIYDVDGNAINVDEATEYIIFPFHAETMVDVEYEAPTTETEGMQAHIHCTQCDQYFVLNENAEELQDIIQEVTRESLVIPMLPPYTLGDVDNNGKIETYDALMILYHINGRDALEGTELLAANVVGEDDTIDVWDVLQIIYYINHRIDHF